MSESPILFDELSTPDGACIAVATLNAPKSLNALSLEMIRQLTDKLEAWSRDDRIKAIWLEGAGDKALCAGGDVVALYRAMTEAKHVDEAAAFAEAYFSAEYRLDYRIHTCAKPLVVWGNGIVMGGGLGLMAGGGQRIATESTRIAMPEITIGLYPDIGASWFLNRMPPGVGAYLGLTGAQLNARDALDLGLADRLIPHARRRDVLAALASADLGDPEAAVRSVLREFEARGEAPEAQVLPRLDRLQSLLDAATVNEAVTRILDDDVSDDWLAANRQRLAVGCPMSAHLVWRMLKRHRHASLADAFRDELNLSVQCCRHGDLAEGVRALLVDKDKTPRWAHADVARVPERDIEDFLSPLWSPESHPLRDL
ncbi:Enoyl-CoA hydratase/carnithine racemase [Modicisalibacter ilicicola DSM 19980]|uniref:3-hydroxyisobutyryl-CoA hydrolase n=1 Tax=Modicisalibacter ilicicola DSM 19980 TaxID=1121942 RepID=A0A1M4Z432_9GAMM|nr:enoyl-CoA hydratase/isomerase family protein [Halomonas ilicicola]SHF12829.1 Enoyl-CoA hydratase/carnithine racemase [Halomonas ilicicola DSM 19980]